MREEIVERIKRTLSIATLLIFTVSLQASATELYWYLAASMIKPGQEIVTTFNNSKAPFTVILISGGSGQLLSKIKTSGKADLYTPASMQYLEGVKKLHLYKKSIPFLIQTPVFALSRTGRQKILGWNDLIKPDIRIGLGNPATMALGRSYQKIEKKMGPKLCKALTDLTVVRAINITQIINYLETGIIDAGIAFASTATTNNLPYITIPPEFNHTETAPIITLTSETNSKNSDFFILFVHNNLAIFKKYGFEPVSNHHGWSKFSGHNHNEQ